MEENEERESEQVPQEDQTQEQNTNDAEDAQDPDQNEETGEPETEEKEESLEDQIEALKKENADLKDQLLRRAADFDNYRKRTIKEKQEAFDYANENLLKDLLDSLDNFDRTVEACATATDAKSIADGIKMVSDNLTKLLESKYSLSSFGAEGDAFDPEIHEAIGKSEGDVKEPVLKQVFLKGYKLKDRIIRHAKVMVEMPSGN